MTRDKWVLTGTQIKDQKRVIIKASNLPLGIEEINKEREARDLLRKISFANEELLFPVEVYYGNSGEYLFFVTEFIPQNKVFPSFNIEEQFFMGLTIFEHQELFHATTFEHLRAIEKTFDIHNSQDYFDGFEKFKDNISLVVSDQNMLKILEKAGHLLYSNGLLLDTYCNHLTHTDLVPGNTRINGREIYILDLSSVRFGNKYEGWARFLNWALIHSPELEKLLVNYVSENRGEEELLSLNLMRIFKTTLLIDYYVRSLPKTEGDLNLLTQKRIEFWFKVLEAFNENKTLTEKEIQSYRDTRNKLRSPEEKERQKEFNLPTL